MSKELHWSRLIPFWWQKSFIAVAAAVWLECGTGGFISELWLLYLTPLIRHQAPLTVVYYPPVVFGVWRNGARSLLCGLAWCLAWCLVEVVGMYGVFWRGLPHQHIVGFHSLELYILVTNMSQFVAPGQTYIRLGVAPYKLALGHILVEEGADSSIVRWVAWSWFSSAAPSCDATQLHLAWISRTQRCPPVKYEIVSCSPHHANTKSWCTTFWFHITIGFFVPNISFLFMS